MEQSNDLPVTRFQFRLSARDPQDRMLSQLMADDLENNDVNLSAVVKSLLLGWYQQRMQTGDMSMGMMGFNPMLAAGGGPGTNGNGHHQEEEQHEDPDDPLVRNMVGVSFDDLVFDKS